jgi:hypothetical protein
MANIYYDDVATVGEVTSVLFTYLNSPLNALFILNNMGVNTINYDFQQYNGSAWVDIAAIGSPTNNTIQPGQVVYVPLISTYPNIQLTGNASGGSLLGFSLSNFYQRAAGGKIPILNLI